MMLIAATLCIFNAAVQGFTASQATSRPTTAPLNMVPYDFALQVITPDLAFTPEVVDVKIPSAVYQYSLFSRVQGFIFGESDVIEEEITNGMVHALLDFGTFWSENAVLLRLFTVLGRIIVILHSFSHGHEVLPDELAFQFGFLGLSCNALYKAVMPKIRVRKTPLMMTSKDRLAFRSLFRVAGFSWQQFRESHLASMSWVTMEPGEVILDESKDDSVFWLYRGDVEVRNRDAAVHNISSNTEIAGMGLLGEKRLASLMDNFRDGHQEQDTSKAMTYVAGKNGATLLRMDIPKLKDFLKHNDDMVNPFGRLAFNVMQEKLHALSMTKSN